MKNRTLKALSTLSCLFVLLSAFCFPAAAEEVKTSTSGIHVETQVGKDGKITMVQVKDAGPQITIDETAITCDTDPSTWTKLHDGTVIGKTVSVNFSGFQSSIDTANKCIHVHFGGGTGDTQTLKDLGAKILNPAGDEIYYWDDGRCSLKIPYSDISFVKEMYMTYGDQRVKMTVA
ncbi:MAG: hypothetical protein LKJ17_12115 [Oscillospiraceae bacterium]|nr:hypothetical protein [Oscillospiraceae bacterium]